MGKLGFISDAHGNPIGLQACVDALRARGAERLFFLGDAVGYLPLAEEVLGILDGEQAQCQLGNHEAMLCGMLPLDPAKDKTYRIGELGARLDAGKKSAIGAWPRRRAIVEGRMRLLLVHGSPSEELTGYVYPNSELDEFARLDYDMVFLGQTHIPFSRRAGAVQVINVGSCGLPRDGTSDASCALLDTGTGELELLRIKFDVQSLLRLADARAVVPAAVRRLLLKAAA
jgi:predicted phosphodiesterase